MIVKFMTDVPFKERLRILWYGRVYVQADYRGQKKPLKIELGAVSKNLAETGEK